MKNYALMALFIIVAGGICIAVGFCAAYMAVKHGAPFGVLMIGVIVGAVLLIDWKGGRNEQV